MEHTFPLPRNCPNCLQIVFVSKLSKLSPNCLCLEIVQTVSKLSLSRNCPNCLQIVFVSKLSKLSPNCLVFDCLTKVRDTEGSTSASSKQGYHGRRGPRKICCRSPEKAFDPRSQVLNFTSLSNPPVRTKPSRSDGLIPQTSVGSKLH